MSLAQPHELLLKFQDSVGQTGTTHVSISAGSMVFTPAQLIPFPFGVVLGTGARSPKEDAKRFSEIELVGRQDEVLNTLKLLDPRLSRLAVLFLGDVPMIYGDIGIGQLVPLPQMGEGIVRLLSIILEIARAPHGVVLVDEIENGLHHSVMLKVWKAIANAARRSETQIFATTHSWECIRAAHEAFTESGTYDFRLHRLDWVKDEIRVVTYDQETLATSIEMNLEVR